MVCFLDDCQVAIDTAKSQARHDNVLYVVWRVGTFFTSLPENVTPPSLPGAVTRAFASYDSDGLVQTPFDNLGV